MACILQVTGLLLDGYPIWVNNKIIPRAKLDIKPDECLLSALLLYKYIAINGKAITMLSFAEIAAARRAPEILNLA